jgi:hypothetical protein
MSRSGQRQAEVARIEMADAKPYLPVIAQGPEWSARRLPRQFPTGGRAAELAAFEMTGRVGFTEPRALPSGDFTWFDWWTGGGL